LIRGYMETFWKQILGGHRFATEKPISLLAWASFIIGVVKGDGIGESYK